MQWFSVGQMAFYPIFKPTKAGRDRHLGINEQLAVKIGAGFGRRREIK